jgi:hypothetical protein
MRAAMRKREAKQPRKHEKAEADVFLCTAGSNVGSIKRETADSVGVKERGEHTKVGRTYLGDLTGSAKER